MHKCSKCQETKPVEAFAKNKTTKNGLNRWCRQCMSSRAKKHYAENKEMLLAQCAEYREANRDKTRQAVRNHYYRNRERLVEHHKQWHKDNPERSKKIKTEIRHRRRARMHNVAYEPVDIEVLYVRDKGICQLCQEPVSLENKSLDHRIALANGGSHTYDNTQLAHYSCNVAKGTYSMEQWNAIRDLVCVTQTN